MYYMIAFITSILAAFLVYITLNKNVADKVKILNMAKNNEDYCSKELTKKEIYFAIAIIIIITYVATLRIFFRVNDWINIIKMLLGLLGLTGSSCVDYREQRIPNIFPLILAVGGCICLAVGYFIQQNGAVSYIISSVFATVVSVVCLTVAAFLTRGGIGVGDIKLFGGLAIIGGVNVICGTLFFSVFCCSVVSVFLLLFKKKSLETTIPFGPFIYLGYIATILIFKF